LDLKYSWDEAKRNRVMAERGIDFPILAFALFDGRLVLTLPTYGDSEERFITIGPVEGKLFAIVWTKRDGGVRIITARRARNGEEEQYRDLLNRTVGSNDRSR
jgi:uncharacterized DUF497 family protein